MTRDELLKRFPNASAAFIRNNCDAGHERLPTQERAQPARSLVRDSPSKQAGQGGGQERYRVTWRLYSYQPLDWDNAAASIKAAQDALVEDGWLPDDNYRVLEGSAVSIKVNTRTEQRTEVTIERIG